MRNSKMKVKLTKKYTKTHKNNKKHVNRITIPKLLMDQCQWDKKEYLNISMGFQSNGKPYLMINETEN
jgi:hypothetical protein